MKHEQLAEPLPHDPLPMLNAWIAEARDSGAYPNADAMALATSNPNGQPTTRIVLCKQIVNDPGYAVFYTNYTSTKGEAIAANNAVSAVFHWDHMNRQARLEGRAVASPAEESDRYFASRDRESQIGAWASAQSQVIHERSQLVRAMQAMQQRFADTPEIPRPPHWGGYRIWLTAVELWVRGEARLHDRGRWERHLGEAGGAGSFRPDDWQSQRLQP
jgi:pyridoxamine 5'-phosphate oxidase